MMTPFSLKMTIDAPLHLPLTRMEVVSQIEALISILDRMDGDPDDEPDLGWSLTYAHGSTDDREGNDEREWDQAEQGIGDMDGLLEQTGQSL